MSLEHLGNFDEDENHDEIDNQNGINALSSAFSVIFTVFSCSFGAKLIETKYISSILNLIIMFINIGTLIGKTFNFEEISCAYTWMILIISFGYTILTIPIFIWINYSIRQERLQEIKLLYLEKI